MGCGIPNGVRRASIPGGQVGVGCQGPNRTKKACIWWGWKGQNLNGRKMAGVGNDKINLGTSNARKYAYI